MQTAQSPCPIYYLRQGIISCTNSLSRLDEDVKSFPKSSKKDRGRLPVLQISVAGQSRGALHDKFRFLTSFVLASLFERGNGLPLMRKVAKRSFDGRRDSFGTMILSIWPSVWWQIGAKLAGQLSVFVSFLSGKTTHFQAKMMKFYEVFKNVIESMEKDRGLTL